MAYKWTMTPEGKALVRVRHTNADKTTISEKIKDRAGNLYAKMLDGSIRRLDQQKPWRGKSERRQVLKARQSERVALVS